MEQLIAQIPWSVVLFLCFTLGLVPYYPPHFLEKLYMLATGRLKRPVDWFDLFFHGVPWVVLVLKIMYD